MSKENTQSKYKMEIKIIEDKEQPLLNRREVTAEVEFPAQTPSRLELRSKLAEILKSQENLVVVVKIDVDFGFRKAKVLTHVYTKEDDLSNIEPKHTIKRHEPKEKAEKAKPPAEAAAEAEKPAEEPKAEEAKPTEGKQEDKPEKKEEVKDGKAGEKVKESK